MAERRMFAKKVITSARFLRMPVEAQALYFHLGMQADDDGIVEAFTVMRTTGATEKHLHTLEEKGFVKVLNDEQVTYIEAWKQNNQIRPDRYKESMYAPILADYLNGNQCATDGIPTDNQRETQYRLVEDSTGEDSTGEDKKAAKASPTRHQYGEYSNVLLSDEELDKLKAEFPSDWQSRIERLSEYIASTGKKYKNHLATLRSWARKEHKEGTAQYSKPRANPCDAVKPEDYEDQFPW